MTHDAENDLLADLLALAEEWERHADEDPYDAGNPGGYAADLRDVLDRHTTRVIPPGECRCHEVLSGGGHTLACRLNTRVTPPGEEQP